MSVNIFDETRRLVSAREVAELNGFHPNRSGFICCPLHHEKTASLKLYSNGTWYCFGCHKGGSSIDFAVELYGLTPLDAVRRLNEDFHLGLPLDSPPSKTERAEAQHRREVSDTYQLFEEWRKALLYRLCNTYRMAHIALLNLKDWDSLTDQEALAIRMRSTVEHWIDTLSDGTPEAQMEMFRERRVIQSRIDQILSNTPMKSRTS